MDLATVLGYALGIFFVLVLGIGLNSVSNFIDIPSVAIVFGGGIGATMICVKLEDLLGTWRVAMKIFIADKDNPIDLIKKIVEFAEIARRDGILALENVTDQLKDEFLVKGIQLAVDGTDPELIENILSTEIECISKRHGRAKGFFEAFEKYAPGWGMIGTLIGLINMLAGGMDNPAVLTQGMAVALITTMYGSMIANLLVGPVATKLAMLNSSELLIKTIILKGVLAIQSGDNPRIVEMKLKIFLPPGQRNFGKEE